MTDAPDNVAGRPRVIKMPFSDRFLSMESINCKEPIVFHYTSAAGALGILSSAQLWSTLVYHMNDSLECKYAHHVAMECAYKLLQRTATEHRQKFLDEFRSQLERVSDVLVFAACFSEASDLLSQWRGYSNSGGYALGLSLEALREVARAQDLVVAEVIYKHNEQEALFRAQIKQLLENYDHTLYPKVNRQAIDAIFRPTIAFIAGESARIKSDAFSEEREWRIYSKPFGTAHRKMEFIVRNEQIVPILEINLDNGEKTIAERPRRDLCVRTYRASPGPDGYARLNALSAVFQRNNVYSHLGSLSMTSLR